MKNAMSDTGTLPAAVRPFSIRPADTLRAVGGAVHEAVTLPVYRVLHKLILRHLLKYASRMHHA